MKKETISTFSEGLNYDLNPITTPNNVLTENINGTFITFNGDELALQNDAGNTRILAYTGKQLWESGETYTKGTIVYTEVDNNKQFYKALSDTDSEVTDLNNWLLLDEYVQLSNGFYPIGIKEYGGVLYIVSTNGNYIEFGSYPSPEFITGSYNQGNIYSSVNNNIDSMLYNPTIINDLEFKSGSYITFAKSELQNLTDPSYVSSYSKDKVYTKEIYVVKLWHQLSNGFIDLTNDVWNQYNKFRIQNDIFTELTINAIKDDSIIYVKNISAFPNKGSFVLNGIKYTYNNKGIDPMKGPYFSGLTPLLISNIDYTSAILSRYSKYWFMTEDFKYYCPNQYRGKLAISLELESLDKFEFFEYPDIKFTINNDKLIVNDVTNLQISGGWVKINDSFYHYNEITENKLILYSSTYADAKKDDDVFVVNLNNGTTLTESLDAGIYFEISVTNGNLITSATNEIIIDNNEIFKYDRIVDNKLIFDNGIELQNSYPINSEIKNITLEPTSSIKLIEDFGSYYTIIGNLTWGNLGIIKIIGADIVWKYNGEQIYQSTINALYDINNSTSLLEQQPYSMKFSSNLYKEKIITHEITPILEINGLKYGLLEKIANNEITQNKLPYNYINRYKLFGEQLLSTILADVRFELYDSLNTKLCDANNIGFRIYPIIILKNSYGYINAKGDVVDIPHIFKLDSYSLPENFNANTLLTYNIDNNGYPIIVNNIAEVPDDLINMFKLVQVYKYSTTCDKIILSVKTNISASITIKQNGVIIDVLDTDDSIPEEAEISSGIPVTIYNGNNDILIQDIYTSNTSLNLAIIEYFDIETVDAVTTSGDKYKSTIIWNYNVSLSSYFKIKINGLLHDMVNSTGWGYRTEYYSQTNEPLSISLETDSFENISLNYDNIDTSNFVKLTDIYNTDYIFNKAFSLSQTPDNNTI